MKTKFSVSVKDSTKGMKNRLQQIGFAQKRAVAAAMNEGLRRGQDFVSKEAASDTPLKRGRGKKSVGSRGYIKKAKTGYNKAALVINERKPSFADKLPFKVHYITNNKGKKVQRGVSVKVKGKTVFYKNAKYYAPKKLIYSINKETGEKARLRVSKLQDVFLENSSTQKMTGYMTDEFMKALIKTTDNELRKLKNK